MIKDANPRAPELKHILIIGFIIVIIIGGMLFGVPLYKVWARGLEGKAQLKEAEWNRQIAIKEAEAEMEAAKMLKLADIVRAEGVAEANKIIADSITEEYLKYKFVEGLNDGNTEVIYVPTEANLPILEARNER